jgi:hypothetical protein
MMEDDDDLRRVLGNWDPKQNKKAYSNKLPMKIIRQKAGFREADGKYYNPPVTVTPPQSLKDRVFPWLTVTSSTHDTYGFPSEEKLTASKFLLFMKNLTEVVLQDAAVIFFQHPNRLYHPVFGLDLFQSEEFNSYVEVMRSSLGSSTSPLDASLERVLPGMNSQFNTLSSGRPRTIIPKPTVDAEEFAVHLRPIG